MTMSHFQTLLFLVVILFFVPSFHALNFELCDPKFQHSDYLEVTHVKSYPNQPNAVTVSGLAKGSMKGSIEVAVRAGEVTYFHSNLCSCLNLNEGNHFVIPITELPYEFIEGESKYVYFIKFWENVRGFAGSVSGYEQMCIKFEMPTSAPTLNVTIPTIP